MSEVLTRLAADVLELRQGTDDDGHFIRGIVAPYDTPTDLGDIWESFAPGVFRRSIDHRGDRIGLMEQHNRQTFPVGMASSWEDTSDGLVGTFRVAPTDRGREALELASSGFLNGLSVGFIPTENKPGREISGRSHVVRTQAKLDHVGLVHAPAYDTARVLEARDDAAAFDPDNPAVAPRLARFRALHGYRRVT